MAEQSNESKPVKVVSERGLVKRYGRFARRHVQAHRLQLLCVEVEDEGHARGQRSLTAGSVRGQETGQDRCHDTGGNEHEGNHIHSVLHRHEPI